jgi:Skp family chaperone for outer membrane proteins
MKTFLRKGFFVIIAAALSLGAFSGAAQGTPGALKIGVVDMKKVFDNYYKTAQTDASFKAEAESIDKERKDMIEEGRKTEEQYKKLLDSANDMAVSKEERDKAKASAEEKYRDLINRKDAIEQYDRQAMARMNEEKRQKRDGLVSEIKDHLVAQAKAGAYNLVFDTSGESENLLPVAIYASGLPDLTASLLKELNAGAPASATTNSPAATNADHK